MVIEIVDFPIKNGCIFYSYVNVYQRESGSIRTFADWIRGGERLQTNAFLFITVPGTHTQ